MCVPSSWGQDQAPVLGSDFSSGGRGDSFSGVEGSDPQDPPEIQAALIHDSPRAALYDPVTQKSVTHLSVMRVCFSLSEVGESESVFFVTNCP